METTNFETQNPIPDIQISTDSALSNTPVPNKKIFKILFFIFLGLFLIIASIYAYLWVKSDQQAQNSKTETQNQVTENIIPTETQIPTSISTTATDETQNWQTYKNEEFNFKYPLNWNIENESIDKDNTSIILKLKLIPQKQESCAESPAGNGVMCLDDISISIENNRENLDTFLSDSSNFSNLKNITTNNNNIYTFDATNSYDGVDSKTVCYVFKNGKVLWIKGNYLSKSEEEIFNKITSSIKIN